jgi:hypothetical protein
LVVLNQKRTISIPIKSFPFALGQCKILSAPKVLSMQIHRSMLVRSRITVKWDSKLKIKYLNRPFQFRLATDILCPLFEGSQISLVQRERHSLLTVAYVVLLPDCPCGAISIHNSNAGYIPVPVLSDDMNLEDLSTRSSGGRGRSSDGGEAGAVAHLQGDM